MSFSLRLDLVLADNNGPERLDELGGGGIVLKDLGSWAESLFEFNILILLD
jgi:hypothetical protein